MTKLQRLARWRSLEGFWWIVNERKRSRLALLAALAHLHANVGDQEHAEQAPGDDLKVEHDKVSSGDHEHALYRLIFIDPQCSDEQKLDKNDAAR